MFKIKWGTAPAAFQNDFWGTYNRYPTWFSQSNFAEGNILLAQIKIAVSSQGPSFWNKLLNQEKKIWHMLMVLRTQQKLHFLV